MSGPLRGDGSAEPGSFVDRFERWMLTAVSHRHGLDAGLIEAAPILHGAALPDVVLPSQRVSAHRRMEIYADMYFLRLVDILREDYPATVHALGERANDVLRDYLAQHPSTNPRLTPLGQHLAVWLREQRSDLAAHRFLADLAALEYAHEVVFEGPPCEALTPEAFAHIPVDQWAELKLPLVSSHAFLDLEYPVERYALSVRQKQPAEIPTAETTHLVMWRDGYLVEWQPVAPYAAQILKALAAGLTVGEALDAALDAGADFDELAASLQGWFEAWSRGGLFARPSHPAAPARAPTVG